ncbi:MAG: FAD-binding protein, partial [Gammaproteobacteria bacterium]
VIRKRLPGIYDMVRTFLHIDPVSEPVPVFPTCHYSMGGIPTNRFGQVVVPELQGEEPVPGLYAVGECACVSVHGANRLGGNSLLDIVVFGRAAGNHIIEFLRESRYHRRLEGDSIECALQRLARWERKGDGETVDGLRDELQRTMEEYCGVFRSEEVLRQGVEKVQELEGRLQHVTLKDHSRIFNTARIEALELENLMDVALAAVTSALARQESRGAHSRIDYPQRDDERWLKHSLFFKEGCQLDYKPVRMKPLSVEPFPPKERVY